ncbi:MAG: sensor histidine kinase [Propioniciclava sp.]|uniref:sensor histidine kinase n=1 Tax=Propioniciclava sp. TaxID=2038686 RepID=UPI0039E26DB5
MARKGSADVAVEVTRVALVLRLTSLLLVLTSLGQVSVPALLGQIAIGVIALWLLLSRRGDSLVSRHPWLVMADTLLLAGVAVLSGGNSPFVLTFMTTAILVGVWAPPLIGFATIVVTIVLYLMLWTENWGIAGISAMAIPFCYLVLWWLGFAVQESSRAESRARAALQRAVSVAAASEERDRLARDLHDTLAKSLQGLHMMAVALPTLVARDQQASTAHALEIRDLSAHAIGEARALMTHLRRQPAGDSLPDMLQQLCVSWEESTGTSIVTEIDESIEVTDELVRYELLMAVSEALENARRHAGARLVRVSLDGTSDDVRVTVADDGVGVSDERLLEAERDGHYGRRGMEERLAKVGGTAALVSTPGRGTTVTLSAPRRGLIEVEGVWNAQQA